MGKPATSDELLAELMRRATEALEHPGRGASREASVARARAAVDAARARKAT